MVGEQFNLQTFSTIFGCASTAKCDNRAKSCYATWEFNRQDDNVLDNRIRNLSFLRKMSFCQIRYFLVVRRMLRKTFITFRMYLVLVFDDLYFHCHATFAYCT